MVQVARAVNSELVVLYSVKLGLPLLAVIGVHPLTAPRRGDGSTYKSTAADRFVVAAHPRSLRKDHWQ